MVALFLPVSPATADPEPVYDVEQVIHQLERARIVRLPGAVATFDEARVLAALPQDARLLVAPAIKAAPDEEVWRDTLFPVLQWADNAGLPLTVVRGLWVERGIPVDPFTTDDEPTLRKWLAYQDVTAAVLRVRTAGPELVPATAAQLDRLPVTTVRPGVRLARLPVLGPGDPFVDYAPGLADRFPGELVVVAYGRWLEFAGPGAGQAERDRAIVYGESRLDRRTADEQLTAVLDHVPAPVARPRFDMTPEPRPDVQGVSQVVAAVAIVVVVAAWLAGLRLRRAARDRAAASRLRLATAAANARIEDLGARLLAAPDPQVAERLATARAMFGQAVTAEAMVAVCDIADEGLAAT